MSVVFHRSAGKMILKGFVATILISFGWIKSVASGTSYSNVYVQSGPGLSLYGPAAFRTAPLSPLAAAPLMSSLLPPCVSPCVVPGQQVAALAPVPTSSADFVSLKSPITVPVVVAPTNDDPASYEYSYVVYDENTGDQKAQKETSDGSAVRGQYSLIQPDGYVREVQYTADDLRGFNAVVKNFLPESEAKAISPCPEVKSEPIKVSNEKSDEAQNLATAVRGEPHMEKENNEEHPAPKGEEKEEAREGPKRQKRPGEFQEPETNAQIAKRGKDDKIESYEKRVEYGVPKGQTEPEKQKEQTIEKPGSEKTEEKPRVAQGGAVVPGDVNALVSYNDVIKCIQSAIKRANMPQPSVSPLTYIILNKPC